MPKIDEHKCSDCGKYFTTIFTLRKHAKRFHPDNVNNIAPKRQFKYHCNHCPKNFNDLKHLKYHERKQHTSLPGRVLKQHQCNVCFTFKAPKAELLRHFETIHKIKIKTYTLKFETFEKFCEWKKSMEAKTHSLFVKLSGTRIYRSKAVSKYQCHRSGKFSSRGKGLRSLKGQGSNKIDGYCPASIRIEVDNNNICKVFYINKHVGHKNDLHHLTLTDSEKECLKSKIAAKIPLNEILDDVRHSVLGSHEVKRIHLVTKGDLHNIEKSLNLKSTAVQDQNDDMSFEDLVRKMESSGCVLFYKAEGDSSVYHKALYQEDFVLIFMNPGQEELLRKYCSYIICINRTHELNDEGLELHTLVVLDDAKQAFPCAFLISNRSDEEVLKIFYYYVKKKLGFRIQSDIFMSDISEHYYNAWQLVMGPTEVRLYCTWHVDEDWRMNLLKIKDKEKRILTFRHLRNMLQESDVEEFCSQIKIFNSSMRGYLDSDTANFAEYFSDNYIDNAHCWAYCYRTEIDLTANMHLEKTHNSIKYIYTEGQKANRLDKAIRGIQKFVRDRMFNRFNVFDKVRLSDKLREVRSRHRASEKLSSNLVVEKGAFWEVHSNSPDSMEVYSIEENENALSCHCNLICTECDTCIHRYSCSCVDSCIRWTMCKHVHLLCRLLKERPQDITKSEEYEVDIDSHENILLDEKTGYFIAKELVDNDEDIEDENSVNKNNIDQNYEDENNEDIDEINEDENYDELSEAKEHIINNLIPGLIRAAENINCMEQVHAFKKLFAPIVPTLEAMENIEKSCVDQTPVPNLVAIVNNKIVTPLPNLIRFRATKQDYCSS